MKEKKLYETDFRGLILFVFMLACLSFLLSSLSSGATVYYLISFEVSIASLSLYGTHWYSEELFSVSEPIFCFFVTLTFLELSS